MVTPFCLAISSTGRDKCDSWLSYIRRQGLSFKEDVHFMKCFMTSKNSSLFIQPDWVDKPNVSGGASLTMQDLKLTRGNIMAGGKQLPCALMMQHVVTNVPCSALDTCETCRIPFCLTIFLDI